VDRGMGLALAHRLDRLNAPVEKFLQQTCFARGVLRIISTPRLRANANDVYPVRRAVSHSVSRSRPASCKMASMELESW
jgi:hypothetical protein